MMESKLNRERNNFVEKLRNSNKVPCVFSISVGSKIADTMAKGSELEN